MSVTDRINALRKFASADRSSVIQSESKTSISKLTTLGKKHADEKSTTVKIKNDFNIIHIHDKIIRKLGEKRDISEISDQIKQCKIHLSRNLSVIDKSFYNQQLKGLVSKYEHINENVKLQEYLEKSKPYIDAYKRIGTLTISFDSDTSRTRDKRFVGSERFNLILSYLDIAKKYHSIDVIHDRGNEPRCNMCDSADIDEDFAGNVYCYDCYAEDVTIVNLPMYRDGTNLSRNGKNDYDDRENFKKALKRYQGRQIDKLYKDILVEKLDKYFKLRNRPTSDDVKKLPLDSRGRRGKTSKGMLYKALKGVNEEEHYEDANLICYLYWNWDLPDVSDIIDDVLKDYGVFSDIYITIRDPSKTSALNTEMTLYCLLRKNGHRCDRKQFKIVSTPSIYRNYVQKIKEIFEIAKRKDTSWVFNSSLW